MFVLKYFLCSCPILVDRSLPLPEIASTRTYSGMSFISNLNLLLNQTLYECWHAYIINCNVYVPLCGYSVCKNMAIKGSAGTSC